MYLYYITTNTVLSHAIIVDSVQYKFIEIFFICLGLGYTKGHMLRFIKLLTIYYYCFKRIKSTETPLKTEVQAMP